MRFLYTCSMCFYVLLIRLSSVFGNSKAKMWLQGRKNLLSSYKDIFDDIIPKEIIWFHISSLGEFEQGRPLIDEIKLKYPKNKILLTFFSPSGYNIRKNYENADYVLYLPADTIKNMNEIVKLICPKIVFFVKYDFWYNLLHILFRNNIPVYFVSSSFTEKKFFFKPYAGWFRNHLKKVNCFFVQTKSSVEVLKNHGITNAIHAGDTRLDRVIKIAEENKKFPFVENFINNRFTYIAGSSWTKDEFFVKKYSEKYNNHAIIIAPHDVSERKIVELENLFKENTIRYSEIEKCSDLKKRILIIDGIGILAHLYKYANLVHIGNGFGKSIHNILEPVAYCKPVIFGPNYSQFPEAIELVISEGAFSFSDIKEYMTITNKIIKDSNFVNSISQKCETYIKENAGATKKIVDYIHNLLK